MPPYLTYTNGALLVLFCAAAAILVSPRLKAVPPRLPIRILSPAVFVLFFGFAFAYTLFPNFIDHAEPAMTSLGIILLKGKPLYPGVDEYSFHGLLYGPLVAEIQAAALSIGSSLGGLPVMISSKLPGLLAFFAATALFFRLARGWGFARAYYILFLAPFAIMVFWNRCEPLFLLQVAVGFWAVDACPRRISPWLAALILGVCAGLASGLKLHAFLYLLPPATLLLAHGRIARRAPLLLAAAAAAAIATFLLLFLPANVSLPAFFDYLRLATGHGLSYGKLLSNLAFIAALWSPLFVAFANNDRRRNLPWRPLLALGALELGVALIGAKAGAGIHHLLPFIPANALLFAHCIESRADGKTPAALDWVWLALLLPGAVALGTYSAHMVGNWKTYALANRQLAVIQAKYPDVVMGVGGISFYPFAFLRPNLEWKGARQVEISSFMDYQLVGLPDAPLQRAFDDCRIGHLVLPRHEPPFSMGNYYYNLSVPLFSDALRETFARRYVKVAVSTWYDVYECKPGKD